MGKRKAKQARLDDLYEAEDSVAEEEKKAGQRYDAVDNFQYELPEDFEDEEIDEDMAFTAEDDELYAHMHGSKRSKRQQEATEEQAEEDGGDAELTRDDFSDDDSEADRLYGKPNGTSPSGAQQEEDLDVDDIFAGISDDEASGEQADAGGEQPDGAAEDAVVAKAVQDAFGAAQHSQSRRAELLDEAVPESEYNLSLGGEGSAELSVVDLMAGLGPDKAKLAKAGKQLEQLARTGQAVAPPLPGPIRARKERQAGYEETKKDVAKWTRIVRANREAPTLVFTGPKNDVPKTTTTAALTAKFRPEGGMEAEVAAMLRAAGVHTDQAVQEAEEALALKAVSAEEMAQRRDELAKMRSLLFKHEEKSRHLAKIKSKAYRRHVRKSARLKAEKAGEVGDQDFIRLEAERAEFERAKERLTLKHKNTSQWARRALKRGVNLHDDGTKEAIDEQLRLGQELRRKIDRVEHRGGSDTDASDADTDASASDSEDAADHDGSKLGRSATAKARAAAAAILEGDDPDDEEGASKGLFSLPFMRRAQQKRKLAAEEEAKRLLAELDGDAATAPEVPLLGRRNFGLQGGVQASNADDEELDSEAGSSDAEEDAEAKRERLLGAAATDRRLSGQTATTSKPSQPPAQPRQRNGPKAKRSLSATAEAAADEVEQPRGTAVMTDGPISVEPIPTAGQVAGQQPLETAAETRVDEAGAVLDQVAKQQASMQGRAHLFSSGSQEPANGTAANGKVANGTPPGTRRKRKKKTGPAVSIGAANSAAAPASGPVDPEQAGFEPAKQFGGAKQGYTFGQGDQGLGYYLDQRQRQQQSSTRNGRKPQATAAEPEDGGHFDAAALIAEAAVAEDGAQPASDNDAEMQPATGGDLTQRELIARAFAGDDVAAEFEAEKAAEVEAELAKIDAPSVMPGWGTWAKQQREPKWMKEAKAKADRQKAAAKAGRQDAKLQAVAISERWDKKAAKFSAASLPYPFNSKDAFEGSMRQPLGADFNTHNSFREMTKPPIIKSTGVIIEPLRFSEPVAEETGRTNKLRNPSRKKMTRISGGMPQGSRK